MVGVIAADLPLHPSKLIPYLSWLTMSLHQDEHHDAKVNTYSFMFHERHTTLKLIVVSDIPKM